MISDILSEQSFLKDVADHKMQIIRDDGLYRHIRFRENGSQIMGFDLVTWPFHLCYTGDMGTYVFSRINDMFEFFRMDEKDFNHNTHGLSINPGYWAQKCFSEDCNGGIKEYSPDKFEKIIRDILDDQQANDDLREAVESEVINSADEGEVRAYDAATSFEHEGFEFMDFWDHDCKEYTRGFIWCCYALAWGINQYDSEKLQKVG